MNREEIMNAIKNLSLSQGFYGRLYNDLMSNDELREKFLLAMEEQDFADVVDMVMFLECN